MRQAFVHEAELRTVFLAPPTDEPEVRERIERSLRDAARWDVLRSGVRELSEDERPLADRLARA